MIEWDEYWRKYTPSKAEKWLIVERTQIINTYLDKLPAVTKEIMEVGCGYGSSIRLIKQSRTDVKCYALDNSRVAIKLIKKDIPNTFVADCRVTPFPGNKFDLIFSAGVMEHFRDETPFLFEMYKILKSDGYLITFVPAKYSLWKLYQLLHFGRWQHGYEKAYSYENLESIFARKGFRVIKIIGIDPFSINGFIMKLLNISFIPIIKKSFLRSGYTELCVIAKKLLR